MKQGKSGCRSAASRFPDCCPLNQDRTEQQYVIRFGCHRFWLALPADKNPEESRLIFVFSGHGGTGESNNANDSIPPMKQFRQQMYAAGFGFVCAHCRPDAWGDANSTEETLAAADCCRRAGLNVPDKIPLLGFSMGGLGVLMFAARCPEQTDRIAEFFGVTDLEDFFQSGKYPEELEPLGTEERIARSPLRYLERYRQIPILIMHGTRDAIVDISYSERLYAALRQQGSPCRWCFCPRGYGLLAVSICWTFSHCGRGMIASCSPS